MAIVGISKYAYWKMPKDVKDKENIKYCLRLFQTWLKIFKIIANLFTAFEDIIIKILTAMF